MNIFEYLNLYNFLFTKMNAYTSV